MACVITHAKGAISLSACMATVSGQDGVADSVS